MNCLHCNKPTQPVCWRCGSAMDVAALESQLTEAREAIRDLLEDAYGPRECAATSISAREWNAKLARLRKVVE